MKATILQLTASIGATVAQLGQQAAGLTVAEGIDLAAAVLMLRQAQRRVNRAAEALERVSSRQQESQRLRQTRGD